MSIETEFDNNGSKIMTTTATNKDTTKTNITANMDNTTNKINDTKVPNILFRGPPTPGDEQQSPMATNQRTFPRSALTLRSPPQNQPQQQQQQGEDMELENTELSIVALDETTIMVDGKRKKVQDIAALAEIEYNEFKAQALDICSTLASTLEKLGTVAKYFEETKNVNVKKEMKTNITEATKSLEALCNAKNRNFYQKACDYLFEITDAKKKRCYSPEKQSTLGLSTNDVCELPAHSSTMVDKSTCTVETQTVEEEFPAPGQIGKNKPKRVVKKPLTADEVKAKIEANEVDELLAARWQDDAYITTKVRAEGLKPSQGNLAVILADSDKDPSKGPLRHFFERYPELEEMRLAEDEVIGATQSSTLWSSHETKERRIIRVKLASSSNDDVVKAFKALESEMDARSVEDIDVPRVANVEFTKLRKLAEIALHSKRATVTLIDATRGPRKSRKRDTEAEDNVPTNAERRGTASWKRRKKVGETTAVVLSMEGKSYAEMLRSAREALKGEKTVQVESIGKTKDDKVILHLKNTKGEAASPTPDLIKNKMQDATVEIKKPRENLKTFHIRGLDQLTTEDEVKKDILAALNMSAEQTGIMVSALRQTNARGSSQAVTVRLRAGPAARLANIGKVKIGLVLCKVRERIEVERCYKCWCTGHDSRSCNGIDRTKACNNCGQDGHKARECTNDPHCPLCNDGHRAWSTQCPKYIVEKNKVLKIRNGGRD